MTKQLRIAPQFTLPLDAVTTTSAAFGIRGAGKTNTAVVLGEELLEQRQQIVVIDPTDNWWGLKSSKDGKHDGYQIIVLGGRHQDLPLAAGDGPVLADFVVDEGASVILSLRHFESNSDRRRFITDFTRRLYYRKGQTDTPTPVMVIIDEASLVVPQRVMGEDARMVGAIQQLVRQGRSSGIGVMLIDQRPATVNKDVLAMIELLIVHRVTSPQDRKALLAWVEQHDAKDQAPKFLDSLAQLEQGVAWFWSPGWLDVFEKVRVRERRTFDSSYTPKAGERVVAPTKVAELDLVALQAKLGATIEKARATDPVQLQKRIRELEAQVRKGVGSASEPTLIQSQVDRAVEIALAEERKRQDRLRRVLRQAAAAAVQHLQLHGDDLVRELNNLKVTYAGHVKEITDKWQAVVAGIDEDWMPAPANSPASASHASRVATSRGVPARTQGTAVRTRAPGVRNDAHGTPSSNGALGAGERAVLIAIAQHGDGVTREQLTVLTGYKRSSRNTYLQRLRSAGLIEFDGETLLATDAGRRTLGDDFEPLPIGDELREYWRARLPEGERRILELLIEAYPDAIDREALGAHTGYKRSSRNTYLQRLQSRQLVTNVGGSDVRASDMLFSSKVR